MQWAVGCLLWYNYENYFTYYKQSLIIICYSPASRCWFSAMWMVVKVLITVCIIISYYYNSVLLFVCSVHNHGNLLFLYARQIIANRQTYRILIITFYIFYFKTGLIYEIIISMKMAESCSCDDKNIVVFC